MKNCGREFDPLRSQVGPLRASVQVALSQSRDGDVAIVKGMT